MQTILLLFNQVSLMKLCMQLNDNIRLHHEFIYFYKFIAIFVVFESVQTLPFVSYIREHIASCQPPSRFKICVFIFKQYVHYDISGSIYFCVLTIKYYTSTFDIVLYKLFTSEVTKLYIAALFNVNFPEKLRIIMVEVVENRYQL